MEALQVLKHHYKQDRLDFVSHLIAKEEDYSLENLTAEAVEEMLASGNVVELNEIARNVIDAERFAREPLYPVNSFL